MVFSSPIFIFVFLPVVFVANILVKKEYSNVLLLFASLIFYAWGEPFMVFLMMLLIIFNWGLGILLSKSEGKIKKWYLLLGIITNLETLGFYKYSSFFSKIINDVLKRDFLIINDKLLPIGISFFTFQALSYVVDVYRGETKASKNLFNVALYISFFPQLIAGPIVKYREINQQIENRNVRWDEVSDGFKRFIYGLGKKVMIANVLGECVDTIYSFNIYDVDSKMAWIAALAYTFQIYFDFSGYSDMAIGLGKMFGFTIPENFNYPYLSKSISEFWRRWHISLGSWFREYVYIPLGGNRKGIIRTYINLIIVFLLTGLWHGANYSFIIWGLYHVLFIIIERVGFSKLLNKNKLVSIGYSFFVINIGWVLFRSADVAIGIEFVKRMLLPWKYPVSSIFSSTYMDNKTIFVFLIALMGSGLIKSCVPEKIKNRWKCSFIEAIYCSIVLLISISSIVSETYNPFIYFQF